MSEEIKRSVIMLDTQVEHHENIKNRFDKFENMSFKMYSKPQEAIIQYMKEFPDIFIIDPYIRNEEGTFSTDIGIKILEQFSHNNHNLEKPVNLIVATDNLNSSLRKVIRQMGIKNICAKTDGVSIETILTALYKNDGGIGLKEVELQIDADIDMIKELLHDVECKEKEEIEYLFREYPVTDGTDPINRDKKRRMLRNIIKYFWDAYEDVAFNMVSKDPKNIWKIVFCRYRAILDKNWISPNVINELYNFTNNQSTNVDNIFYTDEYLLKIWSGEIIPAYNDIVIQEFRRVRDMYSMLKGLVTNSESGYIEAATKFLGLEAMGMLKASKRLFTVDNEELLQAGKEKLFRHEIQSMLKLFTKMCVGMQGSKLPLLFIKSDLASVNSQLTTKLAVHKLIDEIVRIDPKIFVRVKLNEERKFQEYNIYPYVIILPCVSNQGCCWDSWHDSNKRSSPGRIGLPIIFERTLEECVLTALGHLRWRTAKNDADVYWMEEGLTGQYYQYYETNKKRRDDNGQPIVSSLTSPEESFVQDYILWIKFESKGQLKLKKEVREIFWFLVPFSDTVKIHLRGRGQIYEELLLKDERRAQSRFTGN